METLTKPKVKMEKSKRRIYKTSDGVKVPGVTTILSCISKPQLVDWSAKVEREGILKSVGGFGAISIETLEKLIPENYYYKTIRDDAASVGTICHFMCECYLKNVEPDLSEFPKEQVSLAENGFIKFLEFWEKSGFTVIHTERPIVHLHLNYGGTLDIECQDNDGNDVLVDLKTSKAIYPEYWAQVAAYSRLRSSPFKRHFIIRIGKDESNDLQIVEENNLNIYWDLFMGALAVYNAQKEIKNL